MKIFHNPRCSKSRQTLQLIRDRGVEPEIVEYLKTPPCADEILDIVRMLGTAPSALFRTKEALYRELGLHQKEITRDESLEILSENPRLIERPIVISGQRAIIGRPPENVLALFEE